MLKPYALSLALSSSWSRQSKAFDKLVSKAPKALDDFSDFGSLIPTCQTKWIGFWNR